MNGRSLFKTSATDCCTLLLICLAKVFHDGSATLTTGDFECMVCLKRFTLQKEQKNKEKLLSYHHHHHHHHHYQCSAQGQVILCTLSHQTAILPKGRSSTANSET